MVYRATHTLKIREEDYFKAMFSDEFDRFLVERLNLASRTTLYNTETDERIERKVRSVSKELSERAQGILRQKTLTVDEEINVNKITKEFVWRFIPNVFTNTVSIHGRGKIYKNNEESIKREMELEVKVNIPIFGRKIESVIYERIDAWYARVNSSLEDFYHSVYLNKSN